ncbi:protein phosphatase 1E-like [Dysidea avara]|uniref:protein phosphatase 1E-like n=1 Tax=Dysidea avara TaxID=196820 RepID=UPI00332A13F8
MSVEAVQVKGFLEAICSEDIGSVRSGEVANYEAEGEVIDITKTILEKNQCPAEILCLLVGEVRKIVLDEPLDGYVVLPATTVSSGDVASATAKPATSSSPRKLDCGKLSTAVSNALQRICGTWKANLPQLAPPNKRYTVSIRAIKNSRRKMEDRHEHYNDINHLFGLEGLPETAYFAVFDGHAGVEAAIYAKCHLLNNIIRQPLFSSDLNKAITEGINVTDKNFCVKAEEERLRSGTTVVVAIVRGSQLYMGWTGDSQVILVRRGVPVFVSEPHKPSMKTERQRIESLGGCVMWVGSSWRVDGHLSVSRAIGDAEHKPTITSEPDVASIKLDGTEDYLVLACDGIWDVIKPRHVPQLVYTHLTAGGSKESVAKSLIDHAKAEGSSDNMTVIVVFFDTFELIEPPKPAPDTESSEDDDDSD